MHILTIWVLFLCSYLLKFCISNVNIFLRDVLICFLLHSTDWWYWLLNISEFYIFIYIFIYFYFNFSSDAYGKSSMSWGPPLLSLWCLLNVTLDFPLSLTHYITRSCGSSLKYFPIHPLLPIPSICTLASCIWSSEIVSFPLHPVLLLLSLSSLVFILQLLDFLFRKPPSGFSLTFL